MSTAVIWSQSKPDVEFQYGGRLREFNGMSSQSHVSHCRVLPPGEFNGMSSQSHVSHCRVLPLCEFNVTIPEPHATLQGAVTWRNQCHDRATLQGVSIPSALLKIVFRHILFIFLFLMQFRLWQAAAFVSSPIHSLLLLLPPPMRRGLCDRSVCHSVNRITDKRGNGRRPNLAGVGKWWPSRSD